MRRRARAKILWGLGLVLAGCATGRIHVPYDQSRAWPAPSPTASVTFAYARDPLDVSNHTLVEEESSDYVVRLLSFRSVGENGHPGNLITARYYQRKAPGPQSLVIILPIWGGNPYPSSILAEDLVWAGRGNVMLVLSEHTIIDWAALMDAPTVPAFVGAMRRTVERVRASVIDLRRVLDWAERRPDIDVRRAALVGFSESTIQVAGVMASDPRLAAAVLVMGGARPQAVLGTCYGPPAQVRRRIFPRFGWSVAEYEQVLDPLLAPIDPAQLGSRLDPSRVLLFEAQYDDCIPQRARDTLWEAIGHPERISVRSTHAGSFLAMTVLGGNHIRTSILRFLDRTIGSPMPSGAPATDRVERKSG